MSDKKYTPKEVAQELAKSLHRVIAKADPALRSILADLEDPNHEKDVPQDEIPKASPQSVLYKQAPVQPPSLKDNGPKMSSPKNMVSPNINQMALNQKPAAPKAPKAPQGLSMPKSEEKQNETNLSGMGKLKDYLYKRKNKDSKHLEGVHTSGGWTGLEEKGQSMAGRKIERATEPQPNKYLSDLYHNQGKEMHREKLQELKNMPKPNLPKSEEGMAKSEYTPFEVAVEVLKKAESILKAKEDTRAEGKPEVNKMIDPVAHEEREIANQNDIDNEYKQELIDTSKKRLNAYLSKRKAKKAWDKQNG